MKVQDPHFVLEKIEKYLSEDIRPTRHRKAVDIEPWKYLETSMDERIDDAYPVDYDDSAWQDFRLWDTWGGYDRVAWFRTKLAVPEDFRGKQLAIRLLPGPRDGGDSTAEGLLYVNGAPVQGIDIWHDESLLEDKLCGEKELSLALKVWSGVLVPPKFRTFKVAQLIVLDRKVDRFCFMVDTVMHCARLLKEGDLRRIRLTKLLNQTFARVNFLNYPGEEYYRSIYEALDFLSAGLDKLAETDEIKPLVYGVGHSHIDMAWLWRLNATREKASRTFSTVLNLMKQYPEYRFMHSSPQLYKFLEQDYPEIFSQVAERIREGQWEITGGMWVEPDTNVPSGESLVRQFLYGKRYIREKFGKETKLVWLPDVFGYSAAMPQIMKKSGMKYFMTTKISWNQYNHFPYDTFRWKGIDGSEMFTHFITTPEDGSWFYTYNGRMTPEDVVGVWENYKDKDKNDRLLIAYGWGDGGGGPTREMIEQTRVMKNIPGIPKAATSGAEEYFENLYTHVNHDELSVWEGELYFEMHRGTYTSQAANKRSNRKTEILLHNLEAVSFLADRLNGESSYPTEALDRMWERTLLNQFHDILPGSSIRQVYEDTAVDYAAIAKEGGELLDGALSRVCRTIRTAKDSVVLFNTTGLARSEYALLPWGGSLVSGCGVSDENGPCPSQETKDGLLVYVRGVPAYGWRTLQITAPSAAEEPMRLTETEAETPYYRITFTENGEIASLYDKENSRMVSCGQPMNRFAAFEDKPQRFDAWDIDVYYKEKPYQAFALESTEIAECGAERAVLRRTWRFNRSTLTQDLILYRRSRRIDFVTTVDWKEEQVFLKTYFPVDVHASEATYEIQFGSLKRPTHTNTEWDFARFEVPGHRYADLSQADYGAAILNDCKYGWDIHENVMGLSLIKSAVRPDETADRRVHHFTYSFLPHAGAFTESSVPEEAVSLNMPLLTASAAGQEGAEDFGSFSFVSTDAPNVLLDTVKRSEDGSACVVRLYENRNASGETVLRFAWPIRSAVETNLCEEGETPVSFAGNTVTVPMGCFEVKTLKIEF